MSGGKLQLIARGNEDKFITGSPEITFFKTIYRRHTNYSRGEIDIPFNTRLDFGKEGTCKIRKEGDLLNHLFLVITLPEINIKNKHMTIGEIKSLLIECGIKWKTDKQNNKIFNKDDCDDVFIIINNKLDELDNNNNDALICKIGDETFGLIKTLLNALKSGEPSDFAWIQRLGHFIIDHVKVKIGGQLQDKHTGEWMELRHELTKRDSKERGYKILIGDVLELTTFDNTIKRQYELMIPLKFWFCNNMGSSLPLVALQHTDINIIVKLKPFDDCAFFDDNVIFVKKPRLKCKILAEYLYVEEVERTKIVKNKMEYLMDLVQINNDTIITKNSIDDEGTCEIRVHFDNPCKEFVWICQDIDHINGSQRNNEKKWHIYGLDFDTGDINPINSVQIKFSGRVREEFKEINYYNFIVPIEHHYATPSTGINVYSFAITPEEFQPSGSANLGRLSNILLLLDFDPVLFPEESEPEPLIIRVFARTTNILRFTHGMAGTAYTF